MTVANNQQHQAELHKKLWDMANSLRGQMEASEFKNYILGVIFYRFLSEKYEQELAALLQSDEDQNYYRDIWSNNDEGVKQQDFLRARVDDIGFTIKPQYLYSQIVADIANGEFSVLHFKNAINAINSSTINSSTEEVFDHLFDDLDLDSAKLGKTVEDKTRLIRSIIEHVASIPFNHDEAEIDVLGDAYEFMISKFAATAGKSAGEFYTPQQVSTILAKIVANGKTELKNVYDPTCGSGSLLLRVAKELKVKKYFGQELTASTYNLARMNMMLHGVEPKNFDIKNDNTLTVPQHIGEKFEAIVANPPYSAHWDSSHLSNDERFSGYGKFAPKTKADFAFIQHMIYHLDDNGTMAVVLPHGVLFRGAAELAIRKHLIEKNYLDAVIGLPANIFFGTSIPTAILVFKKNRKANESVFFIDASNEFDKGKNSNSLSDSHVDLIVKAYIEKKDISKFSKNVILTEITENGFNLNIPRYIDSSIKEQSIDLTSVDSQLIEVENSLTNVKQKIIDSTKALVHISLVEESAE